MHPEFLARVQAVLSLDVEIGCAEFGLLFVMHIMRDYAGQRRLPKAVPALNRRNAASRCRH
jgi:hypothetical protein